VVNIIMKKQLRTSVNFKSAQQGIVLLEALIAVLLFSMGVLALVGLQATMIKNTADSKLRSDASYLAQQRIGLMWSDPIPASLANFAEVAADISTLLPNGTRTVTVTTTGAAAVPPLIPSTLTTRVTVTINWQQPGKDPHSFTTVANIAGG
jgi:type IV pilus assembly protein PilV